MEKSEKQHKSFENQFVSNTFKYLNRQYLAQIINPFNVLNLLCKILSSKITNELKIKYVLFFLKILKNFTINESVFNQNISNIINDTLGDILNRKADYLLIIHYAIFLVQIGEIDFALSRLQIFSTDIRFMNNGELFFYRAIISYVSDPNSQFFNLFEKSLSLIKKDVHLYCEWVIKFLLNKNLIKELINLVKHDKIREYFEKNEKTQNLNFFNALNDADFIDTHKKINILAKEIEHNYINFLPILKFRELVENYYIDTYNDKTSKFLKKLTKINIEYIFIYLKFLYNHIIYDYRNTQCINLIEEIITQIKNYSDYQINIFNNSQIQTLNEIMIENLKILFEILIKDKICKNILMISINIKKNSQINLNENKIISKYSKKKIRLENEKEKIENINKILNIYDFNYSMIYGEKISNKLKVDFNDKRLFYDYEYTKKCVGIIRRFM